MSLKSQKCNKYLIVNTTVLLSGLDKDNMYIIKLLLPENCQTLVIA